MIVDPNTPQATPLTGYPGIKTSDQIVSEIHGAMAALPPEHQAALDHGLSMMKAPESGIADPGGSVTPERVGGMSAIGDSAISVAPEKVGGIAMPESRSKPEDSASGIPGMAGVPSGDLTRPAGPSDAMPLPAGRSISGRTATLESPRMMLPGSGGYEPLPYPTASPASTELNRLRDSGAGWHGIHNPFLKALAGIGDVAASGLFPQFAQFIPGTSTHHEQLIGNRETQVGDEQRQQKDDDASKLAAANAEHLGAESRETDARAESLRNPPGKVHDEEFFKDGAGAYIGYRDRTGRIFGPNDADIPASVKDVLSAGKPKPEKISTPFEKWLHDNPKGDPLEWVRQEAAAKPKEGETPLKNVDQMNKALEARYQVLHPGTQLPEHFKIPDGATQKDYERIDKALEGTEKAFGTKTQQDTLNEMRKQTMALAQRKDERAAERDPNTEKEYKSVHDSLNKEFAKAESQLQNIDQAQAEINSGAMGQAFGTIKSLVALAGGQGSGVRITQAELDSIAKARGIVGTFEGWLNGLQGKGKLSGDQVNQLNSILSEVKKKGEEKRKQLGGTLDKLSGAKSTGEIRAIEKEYRDAGAHGGPDATVKAYADKYFGGDVAKAQSAIDSQKKK